MTISGGDPESVLTGPWSWIVLRWWEVVTLDASRPVEDPPEAHQGEDEAVEQAPGGRPDARGARRPAGDQRPARPRGQGQERRD